MTKIFGFDKSAETRRTLHTRTHTGKPCQIIFSAILILGAIGHAGAEPTNTSDSFPLNELMQPDYRYLNSAIFPNTGVYDGDVTANAQYDWDLYSPTAGQYLPANSTTITQCTAGNFCAGATNIHYDSVDQGITACSTLGDNSYTQSVAGSTTETDCYRNCSGNVTIEHATTVTGNDYYGNGTDTCSATACEGGYHTDNNACGANVLTIHWANSDNPNTTCTYGGSITTPATAPTIPGKTFVGWAFVDYTPVEYIEGTGTQYIDTGYIPNNNTGVKTKVQLNSIQNTEALVFGSGQKYDSNAFELYLWDRQLEFNYGHTPIFNQYVNINDIIELDWNRNNVSYKLNDNDVESFSMLAQNFSTPYSMYIFSLHRPTQIGDGKIKVYYFKIYDNNTLVRDFIPVKDRNGVACMYDRVGKRFYYNSGTGNFIAGPDL